MATDSWKKYFDNFSFPYGFYSPEEYEPWLREEGFNVVKLELKPKNMVHENEAAFKGWFRTTWLPYLQRIPSELKESFINIVIENYLKTVSQDKNEKIKTVMQRLEFVAAKC
jgi:hypothetical protein